MLRRKVARFGKKGCEVVDESLRSDGSKFAELRRNNRVLGRKVAIVRWKGCCSGRKLAEMWMKFAELRRKFCGVAEESLRSCGEKVVKLQRKICGIAEENIRELLRKVCVAANFMQEEL